MVVGALFLGMAYGYISVKGQFCMNSGFSNVARNKDTTKLKSFILAILIQTLLLTVIFSLLQVYTLKNNGISADCIKLPRLMFFANILGGFLFGIFMNYSGGCAAGIFYKLGEKNTGSLFAITGFISGIFLLEKPLSVLRVKLQKIASFEQPTIWQFFTETSSLIIFSTIVVTLCLAAIRLLLKSKDVKPAKAFWPWKKTGFAIGIVGTTTWLLAIFTHQSYGMSVIPAAIEFSTFSFFSWPALFVIGIPIGAYFSSRKKNKELTIKLPKVKTIIKRLLGGLGLGLSGSLAAGCTVGHGLTFVPLLATGSLLTIISIFLGSASVGYLTRK